MRFVFLERGGEGRAQPDARGVQHQDPRRARGHVHLAGIEEQDAVVALLQDDDRIGLRLDAVLRGELV